MSTTSDPSDLLRQLPSSVWNMLEERLKAFEAAWRQGEEPKIESFLPQDSKHSLSFLFELVLIDQDWRARRGEPFGSEEYLSRFPELKEHPKFVAQLTEAGHTSAPLREQDSTSATEGFPTIPGHEILDKIGEGGMGVVYRARDLNLNRLVALKMVRSVSSAKPDAVTRFFAEPEIVARIRHPNVVTLFQSGQHSGMPYFTMELVEGGTLADRVATGPLDPRDATHLMEQVARGVGDCHANGVLHRDLKPQNVLIADDGTPKVADFGLAKQPDSDQRLTTTGSVFGTPAYMAPEQANGETGKISKATDVYGLGAIFYCLLTGRPPFLAPTFFQTIAQIQSAEPVRPRQLAPGIPRDLETVCLKCLEKDPRKRYQTAEGLAADLKRFLEGRPVLARPVGAIGRVRRWARREPGWALLAAGVFLAVVVATGGLIGFTSYLRSALNEREQELRSEQVNREEQSREEAAWRLKQEENDRYLSRIRLAAESRANSEPDRVRGFLKEAVPGPDRPDLRGFEWRHLSRGSEGPIWSWDHRGAWKTFLAYSPDGNTFATVAGGSAIYLWDRSSGNLQKTLSTQEKEVGIAFSPNGRMLASLSNSGHVAIWELESNPVRCRKEWNVVTKSADSIAFTPEGTALVTSGDEVEIWDTATGGKLAGISSSGKAVPHSKPLGSGAALFCCKESGVWFAEISPYRGELIQCSHPKSSLPAVSWNGIAATADASGDVTLWNTLTRRPSAKKIQVGHQLSALAISVDGRLLATAGGEGIIRLWDVASGERRLDLRGYPETVNSLIFSPDGKEVAAASNAGSYYRWSIIDREQAEALKPDFLTAGPLAWLLGGRTIAVAVRPAKVCLVDVKTLLPVKSLPTSLLGRITAMAASVDGNLLALGGSEGVLEVWDVAAMQRLWAAIAHRADIGCMSFSHDGRMLATGGTDALLELWDTKTGKKTREFRGHTDEILAVAFSHDGKTLATGGKDRTIRTWQVESGQAALPRAERGQVQSLKYFPDGLRVAVLIDGHPEIRDAGTWSPLRSRFLAKEEGVESLALSQDGLTLVGRREDVLILWDLKASSRKERFSFVRRSGYLAISPERMTLAATGSDGGLTLYDFDSGEIRRGIRGALAGIASLAFTPDSRSLITVEPRSPIWTEGPGPFGLGVAHKILRGGTRGSVRVWDVSSGNTAAELSMSAHDVSVTCLAIDLNGRTVVSGQGGTVWEWNPLEPALAKPWFISKQASYYWNTLEWPRHYDLPYQPEFSESVKAIALSPSGEMLATASSTGKICFWDSDHKLIGALPGEFPDAASLIFTLDGATLVEAHALELALWDVKSRSKKCELRGHAWFACCMAVSPNGRLLATGGAFGQVRLWDLATFECVRLLTGHTEIVKGVAFSPDGKTLATGGNDRTVRLWQVETGEELMKLSRHTGPVNAVAFSPDGSTLASGGEGADGGGEVFLWRAVK